MMRSQALSALIFAASASTAALLPRDEPRGSSLPTGKGPEYKPVKVDNIAPRLRPNAKHQLIRYGPVTLPASNIGKAAPGGHSHGDGKGPMPGSPGQPMDPNGIAFTGQFASGICEDCTILAAKIDVVFENGSRADIADGVYLHHLVSNMEGKKQPTWVNACPGDQSKYDKNPYAQALKQLATTGFVGGAVDAFYDYFTTTDGKFNSGYYVPKGAKTSMSGEVINYNPVEQKVFFQLDLEFLDGKIPGEAIKTPLNVEGCSMGNPANSVWKSKDQKGEVKSEEFEVLLDGTVILARAHMHDGGDFVRAYVNNKQVCNSQAIYGQASGASVIVDGKEWQTISQMTECSEQIKLKKGDKIRLVAGFDNIKHPLRTSNGEEQENMGFMVFTFVPGA